MGRCQGEEKLGCSVGGRGDSRSHCETTKPLFKSYHSSPEPGWGWGNPKAYLSEGIDKKAFCHTFFHTSHIWTIVWLQIQILSFISEFSTTVYLHTCNLAYLSVWLSKRVELAKVWVGPQQGQGQGLGARQKAAAAAASPPPGVTPLQVASPPKRPNKAGVPWVRLGQPGSGPGLNIQKRLQQDLRLTEDSEPRNHNLFQTAKCTMLIDMISKFESQCNM